MKKITFGFYLVALSTVLAIVSLIMYKTRWFRPVSSTCF